MNEELIKQIGELAQKFSAGWHEGITIDASDIAAFCEAADALEAADKRIAELSETYTDDNGTVWVPPTAWAYAQVCRVNNESKAKIVELELQLAECQKDAEKWRNHLYYQRRPAHSCTIPGCAVCDPAYGL